MIQWENFSTKCSFRNDDEEIMDNIMSMEDNKGLETRKISKDLGMGSQMCRM